MISIIDYGIGNVRSIQNALKKIGIESNLTHDSDTILDSEAIILPGVGSFGSGSNALKEAGLAKTIKKAAEMNKPILGICLGMQLLMDLGYEFGVNEGLSLIQGSVRQLENINEKIPHIGWNKVSARNEDKLFKNISELEFYFVHSFAVKPTEANESLATCTYGEYEFCAVVKRNYIYGVQFHPEKSGENGLQLLKNFATIEKL